MKKLLHFDGKEIAIEPFKVKQLPIVNRHLIPILQAVQAGQPLSTVLAKYTDSLIAVVTETGIVEKDWLDEQPPNVLIEILTAVMEVNANFFMQVAEATGLSANQTEVATDN